MRFWLPAALPLALLACAGRTPARPAAREAAQAGGTRLAPGEMLVEHDLNHDGRTDVWKVARRAPDGREIAVRSERDLNFDGKIDVWEEYDEAGTQAKQTLDLDFDAKPDLVLHFEKGQLVRKQMGFGFDGKPHAWAFHEKGKLVRKERDQNGDGRVDYWEYWEGGEIDRIGVDVDGDGRVDRWEQRKPQAAGTAPR